MSATNMINCKKRVFSAFHIVGWPFVLAMLTAIAPGQVMPPVINLNRPRVPALSPSPAAILEIDRAIFVLKFGAMQHWKSRDQYLNAFEAMSSIGTNGEPLTQVRSKLLHFLQVNLREHRIFDEGVPIEVEVSRSISELSEDQQAMVADEMVKNGDVH